MPIYNPRKGEKSPPVKENMAGEGVVKPEMVKVVLNKSWSKPSKGVKK